MAKNTNDEPVEPTVPPNRNRLRTVGWIAGGVLALGATFAAGAAVGHVGDGPRGGGPAVGQTGESEHGPRNGKHGEERGGMHGPGQGGHGEDRDGERGPHGPMPDETTPTPDVTP